MIDKLVRSSDGTSGDVPGHDPVLELGQEGESGTSTLLPDIIQLLSTPIKATPNELVSAVKAECDAVMASITRSLQSAVKECQAACESTVAGCTGCLQAKVDTVVRQHSPLLEKCQAKIGFAAKARWDIALDFLNSIGVRMPDQAAIMAVASGVNPQDVVSATTERMRYDSLPLFDTVPPQDSGLGGTTAGSVGLPTGSGGSATKVGSGGNEPVDAISTVTSSPISNRQPDKGQTGPLTLPIGTGPDREGLCSKLITDEPAKSLCNQPGQYADYSGNCVEVYPCPIPTDCPPGYHLVNDPYRGYICVKDDLVPPPATPDCEPPKTKAVEIDSCTFGPPVPPPKFWFTCESGDCDTVTVKVYQGDLPPDLPNGVYAKGPYDTPLICKDLYDPETKRCGPKPPTICPDGYHLDQATGQCIHNDTHCPAQYHVDQVTGQCIPDNFTCPDGYQWNPETQQCELIELPPPPPPLPTPITSSNGFAVCSPADATEYYRLHASGEPTSPTFPGNGKIVDFGCDPGSITNPVGYICELVEKLLNNGVGYISAYANLSPCLTGQFFSAAITSATLNIANGWFGVIPPAMRAMADYEMNAVCQWKIPESEALTQIYIHGYISKEEWAAGMALNGQCLPWQERILEGSWTYPSMEAAIRLHRRDVINDDTLVEYARKSGIPNDNTIGFFYQLTDFVPGPQDIVRFMVRDVEDITVVQGGQLDAEFDQKWAGQLKDWSKWQGIDEETMRRYWRAHWQWPAPTQLYEMFHRIREDTPLPDSDEVAKAVTINEVISVLGINDISPAWRARLAAVSYRVPMRREIGKMYEVGSLDRDELPDRLQDLGYSPDDAKTLGEYIARDSAERRAKQQGLPTRAGTLALYKADGLTYQEATDSLIDSGVDIDAIPGVLDAADRERNAKVRAANVKALRTRFMIGDYSDNQVIAKLSSYGIAVDRIGAIVGQWKEALELKRKEPSVANLCEWAGRGYITPEEYMRRLENLGYTPEDATHFISTCSAKLAESVAKKALAAEKEAERIAKRDAKCRPQSKPLCLPRPVLSHSVQTKQVNGKQPVTTTTDTESISSG